jgi:hypothetical protein
VWNRARRLWDSINQRNNLRIRAIVLSAIKWKLWVLSLRPVFDCTWTRVEVDSHQEVALPTTTSKKSRNSKLEGNTWNKETRSPLNLHLSGWAKPEWGDIVHRLTKPHFQNPLFWHWERSASVVS